MLAWAWVKMRGFLLGAAALAAMLLGVWWLGRQKGKEAGEADAQDARNDAANAAARADQLEARNETDAHVAQLPDAPAQRVGDADPSTAAGQLRDDWSRD